MTDEPTLREASVDFELADLQIEEEWSEESGSGVSLSGFSAELSEDSVILRVPTVKGRTVIIEYKTALDNEHWPFLDELEGDRTVQIMMERNRAGGNRFYRLIAFPSASLAPE